jgi:uncharacterized protein
MLQVTQYLYCYPLDAENYLLLNTLTGATDIVTKRLNDILQPRARVDASLLSSEEIAALVDRGYLLAEEDERANVKRWFTDFKARMKGWHFIVTPTFACNLRCTYCFEDLEIRQSKTALNGSQVDDLFVAMDKLVAERDSQQVNVELYGGEPFLRANRHTVESILRRAAERNWKLSGITNGTQLNHFFDLFTELNGAFAQLQVGMDGPSDVHNKLRIYANGRGSYNEIRDNVTGVLERGIAVALRVNIGINNVHHLPQLCANFEENGWTKYAHFICNLAPITDHQCTGCVDNYQPEFQLLQQLHDLFPDWEAARDRYHLTLGYDLERRTHLLRSALFGKVTPSVRTRDLSGCSASNQHYLVFGADGLLYPCPETVGIPDKSVGRYSPELELDREHWGKWEINISNTPKCVDCSIAPVCGGACPLQGINSSSLDAYTPHCNYAKQTLKTYLDVNRPQLMKMLLG